MHLIVFQPMNYWHVCMHMHVHMCVHMLRSFPGICLNMPLPNNVHCIPASLEKMPHVTSGTVFQHGATDPLLQVHSAWCLTNLPSLLRYLKRVKGSEGNLQDFQTGLLLPGCHGLQFSEQDIMFSFIFIPYQPPTEEGISL